MNMVWNMQDYVAKQREGAGAKDIGDLALASQAIPALMHAANTRF